MTVTDLYLRRKLFAEFIRTSEYKAGIIHFQRELARLSQDQKDGKEKVNQIEWSESWGFIQRLRFVSGKTKDINLDLPHIHQFQLGHDDVDVLLAKGFVDYAKSNYRQAYDYFTEGVEKSESKAHVANYNLMRLHLLAAKCCWRWDDFPQAMAHLALSAFYYMGYEREMSELPEEVKYQEYYRGRIISVYARLLTERRGARNGGSSYNPLAINYLNEAKRFFAKDFILKRKLKQKCSIGHLFQVEIHELQAVLQRNIARTSDSEQNMLKHLSLSEHEVSLAQAIIDHEFGTNPSRRHAHLFRIRGVSMYHKVRWYGRRQKWYNARKKDCKQAIKFFREERKLRESAFGVNRHATISRTWNNRAFAQILKAHTYLNYKKLFSPKKAIDCLEKAKKSIKKSLAANGVGMIVSINDGASLVKKCLSKSQLLASCGHLMEIELRLIKAGIAFTSDSFGRIKKIYQVAIDTEDAYISELSSIIAREDVGRRTHVIHEAMLEACALYEEKLTVSKLAREKLDWLVFDVFRRSLAPHLWGKVEELKANSDDLLTTASWPGKGISVRILDSLLEGDFIDLEMKEQTSLLHEFLRGHKSRLKDVVLRKDFKVTQYTENFTDELGGLMAQFIGVRHAYLLIFAGKEKCIFTPPKLVKVLPNQPYVGVLNIKNDVRELKSIFLDQMEKEEGIIGQQNIKEFWHAQSIKHLEIRKRLRELYCVFGSEIAAVKELERVYVICDSWGWDIPWPALLSPSLEGDGKGMEQSYWIEKVLVSQHASLDMWRDIPRENTGNYLQGGLRVAMAYTNDDLDEASRFKQNLQNMYDLMVTKSNDDFGYLNITSSLYLHKTYPDGNKDDLCREMRKADIVVLLGHSMEVNTHYYRLGFCLQKEGAPSMKTVVLTQHDIQQLNLVKVKILLLLTCRGGEGVKATGNIPRSLFNSFLHAGVPNIVYSTLPLHTDVANKFALQFLYFLRANTLGRSYQEALKGLLHDSDHLQMYHPAKWSGISLVADQNYKLLLP